MKNHLYRKQQTTHICYLEAGRRKVEADLGLEGGHRELCLPGVPADLLEHRKKANEERQWQTTMAILNQHPPGRDVVHPCAAADFAEFVLCDDE
jgi:hypothetical protein